MIVTAADGLFGFVWLNSCNALGCYGSTKLYGYCDEKCALEVAEKFWAFLRSESCVFEAERGLMTFLLLGATFTSIVFAVTEVAPPRFYREAVSMLPLPPEALKSTFRRPDPPANVLLYT